jgi:hypothetical protein
MNRVWRAAAGIAFGLVFALLVAEGAARVLVAQGTLPNRLPADVFASHPIGWTLEPDLHARIVSTNGLVEIRVNDDGFRDDNYAQARTDGVSRLLVLGDSFTLALETPQEETFHTLLETVYAGDVEVIAMGASGYQPAQERLVYEHLGAAYDPDVVLLMLYTGNDLTGNTEWPDLPYYSLGEDGSLTLHDYPYSGAFELPLVAGQHSTRLMRRSMVAFLAGAVIDRSDGPVEGHDDVCRFQLKENFPELTDDDWALTEALLRALRDDVEADGKQFRVVIIPTELQVEPAQKDKFLADCGPVDRPDPAENQARLDAFFEAEAIPYLDLLPVLQAARAETDGDLYLPGSDTHWTAAGHQVVAEALAGWLDLP